MTEEQKALLHSFPKRDRGLFGDDVSDEEGKDGAVPDLVAIEEDPLDAAAVKAKLKQKEMRERRKQREADDPELKQKRVRFVNDEEQSEGSDDDAIDSEDILYDSEEEELEEQEYLLRKAQTAGKAVKITCEKE